MGLAGKHRGNGRRLAIRVRLTLEGGKVINDAVGGVIEERNRDGPRGICQDAVDLRWRQVRTERCGKPITRGG